MRGESEQNPRVSSKDLKDAMMTTYQKLIFQNQRTYDEWSPKIAEHGKQFRAQRLSREIQVLSG